MPSETPAAPYSVAAQSLVYTPLIAVGLVLISWSVIELVSVFTDAYWVVAELVPALVVLTLGTGLTLFGCVGAIARALRATGEKPDQQR